MAENFNFKVSYVRITDEGLERYQDVYLNELTDQDKKDIKALTFLPVNAEYTLDVTPVLCGFSILERLYLPSMMTTSINKLKKECPMLKSLLLLSHDTVANSLDTSVVKVNGTEEDGDNSTEFRSFVTEDKEGRQTFVVNSRQVSNKEIVIEEKIIERLTFNQVQEYISGENGIVASLEAINAEIADDRCKIDITQEVLESLLTIFVEKGVTFEEFTIDFSKLYDKIESYKSIVKTINQVTIKEEIETEIISSYQNVLRVHYENLQKEAAETFLKLVSGVTLKTENLLVHDLKDGIAKLVIDNPEFDEDYREGTTLENMLNQLPTGIARNIRYAKDRGLVRKYVNLAVSELKADKETLFAIVGDKLKERVGLEWARERFAKKFGLDLTKKQPQRLAETFLNLLAAKNLGMITREDFTGILAKILKEMKNGEIRSSELVALITRVVQDYPTKEEIKNVLVDFVAKNGYEAMMPTNA